MKNKEKSDKIINIVAVLAAGLFFIGLIAFIWVGFIGVKIFASGIVIFLADCAAYFWFSTEDKGKRQEERRWKAWQRKVK